MSEKKTEESKLIVGDNADAKAREDEASGCSPTFCRFPASVYFIIVNEFCERFNYFGMRTVLTLYLINFIGLGPNNATAVYHLFVVLCYLSPLLGGVVADSWLGRFRTIVILSIVYCLGCIVLTATAFPSWGLAGAMVGLVLIGTGTGGIKPNVCAFGADQLPPHKSYLRDSFFSCFYFFINLGAVLSTIIIPLIRSRVTCFNNSCYMLAFGVSAIMMALAIVIFVAGKRLYTCTKPGRSIVLDSAACLTSAIRNYFAAEIKDTDKRLLDYADPQRFSPQFIADLRQFSRLLVLYIPFPIFWALFDQIGSRWTIQAASMNGYVAYGLSVLPDQMQAMNPIMILISIPVFDCCIYPLLSKVKLEPSLLKRMGAGMLLSAVAFLAAMLVQQRVEAAAPVLPSSSEMKLKFSNSLSSCSVKFGMASGYSEHLLPNSYGSALLMESSTQLKHLAASSDDCGIRTVHPLTVKLPPGNKSFDIVAYGHKKLQIVVAPASMAKHKKGLALIRAMPLLSDEKYRAAKLMLVKNDLHPTNFTLPLANASAAVAGAAAGDAAAPVTEYAALRSGSYSSRLLLMHYGTGKQKYIRLNNIILRDGQVVTLILTENSAGKPHMTLIEDVRANSVSMMWQIPQYVLISIAEVLFSISGLALSYAEAPESMKSVVQAVWLLCIGIGNIVVMIVSEIRLLPKQSYEFLMFVILMLLNVCLFTALAVRYKPLASQSNGGDSQLQQEMDLQQSEDHHHES